MTAALVPTSCSSRRWRPPSTLTATSCVFELIETTTPALIVTKRPYVNADAARHREAMRRAKILTALDPTTLEVKTGSFFQDFAAESRVACLENKKAIKSFEERQASRVEEQNGHEMRRKEPALDAWSPDAAELTALAAAAASRPGGGGVGPRVALADAYRSFRILNLAEKNITSVDPAFVHFESLTKLDLGRNRLQVLGNLPKALITLSCAANKLSGHALDCVGELPRLSSLDLSYNCLEVDSLLPPDPQPARRRQLLAGGKCNGDSIEAPQGVPEGDRENGALRRAHRAGAKGSNGGRSQPADRPLEFHRKFAALEHLNLSWNCLCCLSRLLRVLSPLQGNLRHLFLVGNPVCLLPAYRERVLGGGACGPRLLVLDDLPVTTTERRSAMESVAASATRFEQTLPPISGSRTVVHQEGEGEGVGSDDGGGGVRRGRGPLDVVHFGVKLLCLSRLPDIGLIVAEGERADDDSKESAAASLESGKAGGTVAAAEIVDAAEADVSGGEGVVEHTRRARWGVVEFVVPGVDDDFIDDDHSANRTSDANTSSIRNARSGKFDWASEVTPPKPAAPIPHRQHEADHNSDHRGTFNGAGGSPVDAGCEGSSDLLAPWETSFPVLPSKTMRDEVHLGGLRVLLFAVEDGDEEQLEDEAAPTDQRGDQNAQGDTPSSKVASDASNKTRSSFDETCGDATATETKHGDDAGKTEAPPAPGSMGPQERPRQGRRRLVGRGCLSLAQFLDPAWMAREKERVQRQQQQQRRRRKDQLRMDTNATVVPGGQKGGTDHDTSDGGGDVGVDDHGAAAVAISGACDVVFEPWVVERLQKDFARRKREREEQEEAARAEAEERAANEPKGKKSAKAAAGAVVPPAEGRAAGGDQETGEREENGIGSCPSATAQVEVTLNSETLIRRFEASGLSLAGARGNLPRDAAHAW